MSKAYLLGALGDATERRYTYRLSQKHRAYVEIIATMVRSLGGRAWVYREGRTRQLYFDVVESITLVRRSIQTTGDFMY